MSLQVQLSPAEEQAYRELKQKIEDYPLPKAFIGDCSQCHRPIPEGYLCFVTRWRSENWGPGFPVQKAVEMVCRDCQEAIQVPVRHRRRHHGAVMSGNGDSTDGLTAKEAAIKLLLVLKECEKPHSTDWLSQKAGLPQNGIAGAVLKKLAEAGKIEKNEEGRWLRKR